MKFICTECDYPGEDNTLQLTLKDSVTHKFYINKNGSLEHCGSSGDGQEFYLECSVCGQKYEFENSEMFELEESFALKKWPSYCSMRTIELTEDDFKIKKVE